MVEHMPLVLPAKGKLNIDVPSRGMITPDEDKIHTLSVLNWN